MPRDSEVMGTTTAVQEKACDEKLRPEPHNEELRLGPHDEDLVMLRLDLDTVKEVLHQIITPPSLRADVSDPRLQEEADHIELKMQVLCQD